RPERRRMGGDRASVVAACGGQATVPSAHARDRINFSPPETGPRTDCIGQVRQITRLRGDHP
ncbi:MAG: hypothetical protein ACREDT_16115, partial [Methylocella sp.]